MDTAAIFVGRMDQIFQITPIIFLGKETRRAIISTLDGVLRCSWQIETRLSWHADLPVCMFGDTD
jgi:hypothetical protein